LENTLDREEMRNSMAGSGGGGSCQACVNCPSYSDVGMVCCAGYNSCWDFQYASDPYVTCDNINYYCGGSV